MAEWLLNFLISDSDITGYTCYLVPSAGTKVEYSAALSGRPGLPSWLTILQVDTASPGYMYGTPGTSDVGKITLEVSGQRVKRTALLHISLYLYM